MFLFSWQYRPTLQSTLSLFIWVCCHVDFTVMYLKNLYSNLINSTKSLQSTLQGSFRRKICSEKTPFGECSFRLKLPPAKIPFSEFFFRWKYCSAKILMAKIQAAKIPSAKNPSTQLTVSYTLTTYIFSILRQHINRWILFYISSLWVMN